MSKQYAHLHTMAKTSVKFQNDWPKTEGGVNKAEKVEKKISENYEQTICKSTHHGQNS